MTDRVAAVLEARRGYTKNRLERFLFLSGNLIIIIWECGLFG